MSRKYSLVFNFKDGTVWDKKNHDVALDAGQISAFISQLEKFGDEAPIELQNSSATPKTAKDLKSIEISFV
jgi:hypothetical protein